MGEAILDDLKAIDFSDAPSLGPERAGPKVLLGLVRDHWVIENRVHYVRDFTYDEDRCWSHVRHLPRNLSCLMNAAIAKPSGGGRFSYMPEANRHYAAAPRTHSTRSLFLRRMNRRS